MTYQEVTPLVPVQQWMDIPILSTIGAAKSFQDIPMDGSLTIAIPPGSRPTDQFCAGLIHGESLYDEGINDGDYVVFRLNFDSSEVRPGRLLAVFTPYGLLLKHAYFTLDGKVRLVSANPVYEDIVLDAEDVKIQGIAVQVVRVL